MAKKVSVCGEGRHTRRDGHPVLTLTPQHFILPPPSLPSPSLSSTPSSLQPFTDSQALRFFSHPPQRYYLLHVNHHTEVLSSASSPHPRLPRRVSVMQSGVSFPPLLDEGREYLLLVCALGLAYLLLEGTQVVVSYPDPTDVSIIASNAYVSGVWVRDYTSRGTESGRQHLLRPEMPTCTPS